MGQRFGQVLYWAAKMSKHADPYRCYRGLPTPDGVDDTTLSGERLTDVYGRNARAVRQELIELLASYGTEVWFGQRHCAPSASWRDETVLELDATARFAMRLHLFEKGAIDAGRYLGFVSLRQDPAPGAEPGFKYVLEAELVPLRRMLRPRYHLITTTASSARLGVLPFRSAVFVALPSNLSRRSTCVNAAISQALHLTMGRFGSRPISHREFDAMLWNRKEKTASIATIAKEGANLAEALDVVQESCSAGGFIASFTPGPPSNEPAVRLEALRCLTDALANGLPVVLRLDCHTLERRMGGIMRDEGKKPCLHASLILGMRLLHSPKEIGWSGAEELAREDWAELPGRLVGHDTARGPFKEWPERFVLDAALNAVDPKDPDKTREIQFLALGPKQMNLGLNAVRHMARMIAIGCQEHLAQYARKHARRQTALKATDWRYVTRMMDLREAAHWYFPDQSSRAELERRKQLLRGACFTDYWWCVEVRHPNPDCPVDWTSPLPAMVFMWKVSDGPSKPEEMEQLPPRVILLWNSRADRLAIAPRRP